MALLRSAITFFLICGYKHGAPPEREYFFDLQL